MITYFTVAILWGTIFGIAVFPTRVRYRIECPDTLGWWVTVSLVHAVVWPFSLLQILGWMYLDSKEPL